MATWKSDPVTVRVSGPYDSENVTYRWEYQTTADVFTLYRNERVVLSGDYDESRIQALAIAHFAFVYLAGRDTTDFLKQFVEKNPFSKEANASRT